VHLEGWYHSVDLEGSYDVEPCYLQHKTASKRHLTSRLVAWWAPDGETDIKSRWVSKLHGHSRVASQCFEGTLSARLFSVHSAIVNALEQTRHQMQRLRAKAGAWTRQASSRHKTPIPHSHHSLYAQPIKRKSDLARADWMRHWRSRVTYLPFIRSFCVCDITCPSHTIVTHHPSSLPGSLPAPLSISLAASLGASLAASLSLALSQGLSRIVSSR